jgi:alkylation response protein AidB-like acyl-CoA dehydrogenase
MPARVGGPGCTALQQVLVQEQCGRVTNGLGWVMATPPQWWVEVATDYQRERWLLPSVRGEKHEAYAITEEFAGSDVSALKATAQRDGDEYVINGVKWHVTSFNLADYVFVEAVVGGGDHVLLVVDLPWPGVEVVRTPQYSHNIADEHPIVAFNVSRSPLPSRRGRGRTHNLHAELVPVRRMMAVVRGGRAAPRRRMTAFATRRWRRAPGGHRVAGMLADSDRIFAARTILHRSPGLSTPDKTERPRTAGLTVKLYCWRWSGG